MSSCSPHRPCGRSDARVETANRTQRVRGSARRTEYAATVTAAISNTSTHADAHQAMVHPNTSLVMPGGDDLDREP
jgi:hypothetical protein